METNFHTFTFDSKINKLDTALKAGDIIDKDLNVAKKGGIIWTITSIVCKLFGFDINKNYRPAVVVASLGNFLRSAHFQHQISETSKIATKSVLVNLRDKLIAKGNHQHTGTLNAMILVYTRTASPTPPSGVPIPPPPPQTQPPVFKRPQNGPNMAALFANINSGQNNLRKTAVINDKSAPVIDLDNDDEQERDSIKTNPLAQAAAAKAQQRGNVDFSQIGNKPKVEPTQHDFRANLRPTPTNSPVKTPDQSNQAATKRKKEPLVFDFSQYEKGEASVSSKQRPEPLPKPANLSFVKAE